MRPEYIDELADMVDPDEIWKRSLLDDTLTDQQKRQRDAGVALRRHASHLRELERALEEKKSILITPLGPSFIAIRMTETPEDHEKLRPKSWIPLKGVPDA